MAYAASQNHDQGDLETYLTAEEGKDVRMSTAQEAPQAG